ncbi:MAG: SPOR domain-containing protein [Bacteroidales bacterium]|nr:SPOR domain-containing protein [Bacteroidales bacterium]
MEISNYIGELLHEHDCVIMPGFGGFVCNYQPAQIHPGQHSFHPPSKKILFNKELKSNDGLLASYIAIQNGISFESALQQIEDAAGELLLRIESGERVNLVNIGILYLDTDANIQFEQDNTVNYLKDAFGLSSFVSPPIQRNIHRQVRKTEPVYTDRRQQPKNKKNLRTATYWTSGVAATFLLITLVMINFDSLNNFVKNETGFLPTFSSKTETHLHIAENTDPVWLPVQTKIIPEAQPNPQPNQEDDLVSKNIYQMNTGADENIEPKTEPVASATPVEEEIKPVAPTEKLNTRMYHLIAGSFEKTENANILIAEYANDGYDPKIIGQADNGYYRVSIAAFIRKEEALTELEKVRVKYNPNIWLLRL